MLTGIVLNFVWTTCLQSANCKNKCLKHFDWWNCETIFKFQSIKSEYFPGSSSSFSMEIDSGRKYMGEFEIQVKIFPTIGWKYFCNVFSSSSIFSLNDFLIFGNHQFWVSRNSKKKFLLSFMNFSLMIYPIKGFLQFILNINLSSNLLLNC